MPITTTTILLAGSLLILVAILLSKVGNRFGIPALLLFLFTGMIFGSDGVGLHFDNASMAQNIGVVALTVILFTGGMDTKMQVIRPIMAPGIVLSTVGVLLTTLFTGLFIHYISLWTFPSITLSLPFSMLLAATMSSTDSASVFALLRSQRVHLKENLKPMLELESGSNDPMAYMLTIVLIDFLKSNSMDAWEMALRFVYQFAFGLLLGFAFAWLIVKLVNKMRIPNRTLYPIVVLSGLFFCYAVCDLIHANGFLAAYIFGITVGNSKIHNRGIINHFFDGITWLLQIILFVMLGLLLNPKNMISSAGLAVTIGLFIMFLGRPMAVFLSLIPFRKLSLRAKVYTSWVGLRGAAPIIFATYPVVAGIEEAHIIFEIVFFITLLSLLLQGMTISPVAKLLHLSEPAPPEGSFIGVEIPEELGANMEERRVTKAMLTGGDKLMNIALEERELVILVRRKDNFIVPKGNVRLHEGDILLIVSPNDESDTNESLIGTLRSKQRSS